MALGVDLNTQTSMGAANKDLGRMANGRRGQRDFHRMCSVACFQIWGVLAGIEFGGGVPH